MVPGLSQCVLVQYSAEVSQSLESGWNVAGDFFHCGMSRNPEEKGTLRNRLHIAPHCCLPRTDCDMCF